MSLRDLKSRLVGGAPRPRWNEEGRTCGECAKFRTCSLLHRSGMVAPTLDACDGFIDNNKTKTQIKE